MSKRVGTSPLKKEVKEEDFVCESEESGSEEGESCTSGSDMEVDDVAYFAPYVPIRLVDLRGRLADNVCSFYRCRPGLAPPPTRQQTQSKENNVRFTPDVTRGTTIHSHLSHNSSL